MGLERLCAVLNGVRSTYETDLVRPLIAHAEKLSGKTLHPSDYAGTSVSLRAIADHARAAAFLIADGVFPDKTGREYVLRRIMRRGIYHGWLLGIKAAVPARDRRRRDQDDGRRLPRAGRAREPDRQDLPRRGDALPRDARSRRAHPDRRDGGRAREGRPRRARVQAVRHLRLPARPDAGHRRRARVDRRRGRLRARDGRAAQAQRVPGLGRGRGGRRVPGDRRSRRRDQVPRLRGDRRQIEDRRAGRRRQGDERGRPVLEERRGRHRRDAVLRRAGRPDGRHRQRWRRSIDGREDDRARLQAPGVDAVGPPRRGAVGRAARRRHGRPGRRRRAARRHPPQPLGDAPAALGAAPRAGHARHAEGLAGRARSPALRLLPLGAADRRGETAGRGSRQRARAQERRRPTPRCCRSPTPSRPARSRSSARSTATPCAS